MHRIVAARTSRARDVAIHETWAADGRGLHPASMQSLVPRSPAFSLFVGSFLCVSRHAFRFRDRVFESPFDRVDLPFVGIRYFLLHTRELTGIVRHLRNARFHETHGKPMKTALFIAAMLLPTRFQRDADRCALEARLAGYEGDTTLD